MAGATMTDSGSKQVSNDYSPWTHPKAKQWFAELLEKTHLPLLIEDALEKPDAELSRGETRLFLSLMIMLGREGIWPDHRQSLFRTVIRKAATAGSQQQTNASSKPLTLEQHRSQGSLSEALEEELGLMRRRIGMSNRKTKLEAPKAWGRYWT
jgi:hypothetical protein